MYTGIYVIFQCVNKVQGSLAKRRTKNQEDDHLENLNLKLQDMLSLHHELFIRLKTALAKQ